MHGVTAFPLSMSTEGEKVKVSLLRGGKSVELRLTSMGLNVGSELTVSQHQGGNVVVVRGETRLALGSSMAQKIIVEKI